MVSIGVVDSRGFSVKTVVISPDSVVVSGLKVVGSKTNSALAGKFLAASFGKVICAKAAVGVPGKQICGLFGKTPLRENCLSQENFFVSKNGRNYLLPPPPV